jgi:hypothetical protein
MENLNENQLVALVLILGLKAFARAEYFEQNGLGQYNKENPIIASLVALRLLSVNKAGSISIDRKKADAVLLQYPTPKRYISGVNAWMHFKRSEE